MPRADFRYKDDVLDPLAPVKVLAVMCHPADPRGRETLLRRLPTTITILRHRQEARTAAEGSGVEFWPRETRAEFDRHAGVASLAGALALGVAQLRALGQDASAAAVMPRAAALLTAWEQVQATDSAGPTTVWLPPRSEAEFLAAFETYRSVAHLWAALVYGGIQHRPDLRPLSRETLPDFLAYADEIARLTSTSGRPHDDPAFGLDPRALWTFLLPFPLMKVSAEEFLCAALGRMGVQQTARGREQCD